MDRPRHSADQAPHKKKPHIKIKKLGAPAKCGKAPARPLIDREISSLKDESADQLADMARLYEFSARLSASVDLKPLLDEALTTLALIQGAKMGVLMLYDRTRRDLFAAASVGFSGKYLSSIGRVPEGVGVCGGAVAQRRSVIIGDVEKNGIFAPGARAAALSGCRALYCVPLLGRHGVPLGTIVTYFQPPHRPSDREVRLVEMFAGRAAEAIENVGLYEEARKAKEALRRQLDFTSAITNHLGEGVYALDREGRVIFINRAAERMLGWTEAELIGKVMHDIVHARRPGGSPMEECRLLKVIRSGEVYRHHDDIFRRKDGSKFPVSYVSGPIITDGIIKGAALAFHDITERKRTEKRLAAEHAVTRLLSETDALTEAAPKILQVICKSLDWEAGCVWVADRRANQLRCVKLWRTPRIRIDLFERLSKKMTLAPGVGLPGRVWSAGAPLWIEDVTQDTPFSRAAIAAKEGLHGACGFPIFSGTETLGVIEFFSREIRTPDDDLLQMMATVGSQIGQFIERKRAEEELKLKKKEAEEASRLKSQFISIVSHELRTPLNAIIGYSALLKEPRFNEDTTKREEMLGRVHYNSKALLNLINGMLDLSKIEAGQMSVELEAVSISGIVGQVLDSLKPTGEEKGLKLAFIDDPTVPVIRSDSGKLRQVFTNLIANAIKFTDRGFVLARIGRHGDEKKVSVTISDTGIG
ncbi:MAG TPA: GAF domain-containing protein, partial [Candidatus Manganitrophaceae bacterium]|nr:GAF domain-containing protein [Candidatus Manganitrophaceae bacterium]